MQALFIWIGFLFTTGASFGASEISPRSWHVSLYAGPGVNDIMQNIVRANLPSFDPNPFAAVSAGKNIVDLGRYSHLEFEAQVGKHFESGNAYQLNGLLGFRWSLLPWDRFVKSSFLFANGLSYASEIPAIERIAGANLSKLLFAISLEFEFLIPGSEDWGIILRVQHGSGIFGLLTQANQGSNFLCLGVKYRL